jgi:inhibitor of KinA sporulation pathway (predicted exonuclease)
MPLRKDRTLYLDLELTCDDGLLDPQHVPDIIQIGIVEVDTQALEITREANYYVKTVRPITAYCTNLTGITPELLKREGRPTLEVLNSLKKKFGPANKVTYAWGDDAVALASACTLHGVDYFFNFVNLATEFGIISGQKESLSLSAALSTLNSVFVGSPHNALDDARNTARLHVEMMKWFRSERSNRTHVRI